jgi:molybdopterin molybdotransferase
VGFAQLTSVADAIAWIDQVFPGQLGTERVPLGAAFGRVLARDAAAATDAPPFDRAVADGYALEAEATLGASLYNPLTFRVDGSGPATLPRAGIVACGSALPAGADAVVPLDHVQEDALGESFEVIEPVAPGADIERAGDEFARGTSLLRAGRRIGPAELALLAAGGLGAIDVVRRPRVRVVVTGRGLVEPGNELPIGAVFDGDTPMLRGLVERDGGTIEVCAADRSSVQAVHEAVVAPHADLVLVVGGSGLGANDEAVLEALGRPGDGEGDGLSIHGIALRPGLSSGIGRIAGKPLFLLPGFPIACFWAYEMLAGRVVRRLAGRASDLPYSLHEFVTASKIVSSIGFLEVWPVRCIPGTDRVEPILAAAPGGAGGLFPTVAEADGFMLVPEASEGIAAGGRARVYLYDRDKPGLDRC